MTHTELAGSKEYELIEELDIRDVKSFVVRELSQHNTWSLIMKMYQAASMLLIGFLLFRAVMAWLHAGQTRYLLWVGLGILFSFTLLIVIHEVIHYLAFLLVGVRKLSFGMNLRKFIFYVQADKEVVNYRQMKIVGLAPLVVVAAAATIMALLNFGGPLYFAGLTVLSIHSLFCAGDLGILSFFENRKEHEIVTYDDKQAGKAYFYKKRIQTK